MTMPKEQRQAERGTWQAYRWPDDDHTWAVSKDGKLMGLFGSGRDAAENWAKEMKERRDH